MEKIRVLIIEDDVIARKQLAKVIEKEGYEVLTAEDGEIGLEVFHKKHPEIIVTDLKMPNIDGIEVMHRVKRTSPNTQIIIITAFGEVDTPILAIREGALDYLKKPLDLDQLSLALGRAKEKISEHKKLSSYPSILFAEDDKNTRERLTRVLKQEKWNVFSASNGEEAINIFRKEKIDIVLLDLKMPIKGGLETLHEMRIISTDYETIILTGYGDETNAIQALRDGAFNFIRKPIELDELILVIEKALEKLNSERSLKYRTRELELSKLIIAKFTKEREFVIDTRNHTRREARDFAQEVMETLPMGMVVFDKNLKIQYINQNTKKFFEVSPEKVNDEFLQNLTKMGINDLSIKSLHDAVNKIYDSEPGTIEKLSTGKYSFMVLIPVSILTEKEMQSDILMVIRGERK